MIANASQLLIVASLKLPSPDWVLLDRLLILGSFSGLKPLIAFNKLDLADEKDLMMPNYYKKTGYDVFLTSAKKKIGLDSLEPVFQNEMTVFAGPSGAGKSSLLNAIDNELKLQTGVVSGKLGRGKHTPRQVELLNLKFGGFVADTPGFSKLDLPKDIKREKLADYFPDIAAYHGLCKFNTCLHRQEPACEVVKAVENGTISRERYENYCCFLDEVIAQERSY